MRLQSNLEWLVYYEHIVQSHGNKCLFGVHFRSVDIAIYH